MSIDPSGWHMDAGTSSWNEKAKTFSFYLHKRGRDRVLCMVSADALEGAAQQAVFPKPPLAKYSMLISC
jgi:hypothetical protein